MGSLAGSTSRGGLTGWAQSARWYHASELVAVDVTDTDWVVAHASNPTVADDTNDASVAVMVLDQTSETGVGLRAFVPAGASAVKITALVRSETSSTGNVQLQIYGRAVTAGVPAWSSAQTLDAVTVAASEQWTQTWGDDTSAILLDDLDLVAGRPCLIQLTRDPSSGNDTLAADCALEGIGLEWI